MSNSTPHPQILSTSISSLYDQVDREFTAALQRVHDASFEDSLKTLFFNDLNYALSAANAGEQLRRIASVVEVLDALKAVQS